MSNFLSALKKVRLPFQNPIFIKNVYGRKEKKERKER